MSGHINLSEVVGGPYDNIFLLPPFHWSFLFHNYFLLQEIIVRKRAPVGKGSDATSARLITGTKSRRLDPFQHLASLKTGQMLPNVDSSAVMGIDFTADAATFGPGNRLSGPNNHSIRKNIGPDSRLPGGSLPLLLLLEAIPDIMFLHRRADNFLRRWNINVWSAAIIDRMRDRWRLTPPQRSCISFPIKEMETLGRSSVTSCDR